MISYDHFILLSFSERWAEFYHQDDHEDDQSVAYMKFSCVNSETRSIFSVSFSGVSDILDIFSVIRSESSSSWMKIDAYRMKLRSRWCFVWCFIKKLKSLILKFRLSLSFRALRDEVLQIVWINSRDFNAFLFFRQYGSLSIEWSRHVVCWILDL